MDSVGADKNLVPFHISTDNGEHFTSWCLYLFSRDQAETD